MPFVGASGRMLDTALARAGLPRAQVFVTNTLLCEPPSERPLAAVLKEIAKENKRRERLRIRDDRAWERYAKAFTRYEVRYARWAARCTALTAQHVLRVERQEARYAVQVARVTRRNAHAAARGRAAEVAVPARAAPPVAPTFPKMPEPPVAPVSPASEELEQLPTPMECCWPRLVRELEGMQTLLLVGGQALTTLTGRTSILAEQGAPITLDPGPAGTPCVAVAVVHPAAILRGLWTFAGPFQHWVARAVRYHREGLPFWADPSPYYTGHRVAHALRTLCALATQRQQDALPPVDLAVDVETDGIDPVTAQLRCVGLAWGASTAVVAIYSVDGQYIADAAAVAALTAVLTHSGICKVFHNGAYDRTSIWTQLGIDVAGSIDDTMLAHHAVESELPHRLDYVSSVLLDAPSWKSLGAGDHGLSVQDDRQLWLYNSIDAWRTLQCMYVLRRVLCEDAVEAIYQQAVALQSIVVDMRLRGLLPDEAAFEETRTRLREHKLRAEREMRQALEAELERTSPERLAELGLRRGMDAPGPPAFPSSRPFSTPGRGVVFVDESAPVTPRGWLEVARMDKKHGQVWDTWDYQRPAHREAVLRLLGIADYVPRSPKTRKPSTKADDLILALPQLGVNAATWIGAPLDGQHDGNAFLGAMSAQKAIATFCDIARAPDGRVRTDWKQLGTPTGRFASAKPNLQNVPKWMRTYCAPAGYKLVGADYSALELWIVAIYAGATSLLKALQSADPHRANAETIFRVDFVERLQRAAATGCGQHASGGGTVRVAGKKFSLELPPAGCADCAAAAQGAFVDTLDRLMHLRDRAKRFVYAGNYGAAITTIWQRLVVDDPGLQLGDVEAIDHAWKRNNPEIEARGHVSMNLFYQRKRRWGMGWLESPILGRRRYWTGKDFGFTDAANYPIQSGGADVINTALVALYPRARALGAFLVAQVHDSLVWEVPEEAVEALVALLEEVMPGPYRMREGLSGEWSFPIEVKVGDQWLEV